MQEGLSRATLIVRDMETGKAVNHGCKTHFLCFNCEGGDGKRPFPFMLPCEEVWGE